MIHYSSVPPRYIFSLLAVFLFLLPCWAGAELPAYNTKIPTTFTGHQQRHKAPGAGEFDVYVSGPEEAKGAIVMIHEWWGLNPHIKGLADQLAMLGYRAYAVDLYDGKLTDDPDMAATYMRMNDATSSMSKLKTTIAMAHEKHGKVAIIGWCFGGGWSLKASLAAPEMVDATVVYYGALVNDPALLKKLRGPVLGIFATQDKWITPDNVAAFEKGLAVAGVKHTVRSYEADHAFANPSGDMFQLEKARDAWRITLEFLDNTLNAEGGK
ncbi:MAG: dienelactone hydrolase family protein [Nitrospinota bacterium]|nr:dienelactone hydrolase family protein [Nitrospinota bacterium]